MKLAILYKSHTSLQTLTDDAQRDKSYRHPRQARGHVYLLAAHWA